jgi:UDP-N-acetylglucosamine 4,6-dehydratase/5-epimerase
MREIKSILITGGTGSFSRALSAFLLQNNMVERLCLFSRGEHAQAQMRESLNNDDRLRFFIGDVRDLSRLRHAMNRVDVVVHAAALKRIEVGRYNAEEMVKTNVLGAMNVVAGARYAGVDRVVSLSTDKAYQPVSAYGTSKLMAEQIILSANDTSSPGDPIFAVTRYGNVWGSAGSVLPKWLDTLQREETVKVTDIECTRFFMTMQEAVELVVGTITHMKGGEIAVPTLPAYRLGDLLTAMRIPAWEVIGLPKWEKLHESMDEGRNSEHARRMTVEELQHHVLAYIDFWRSTK